MFPAVAGRRKLGRRARREDQVESALGVVSIQARKRDGCPPSGLDLSFLARVVERGFDLIVTLASPCGRSSQRFEIRKIAQAPERKHFEFGEGRRPGVLRTSQCAKGIGVARARSKLPAPATKTIS
jgi:hypothetical protein